LYRGIAHGRGTCLQRKHDESMQEVAAADDPNQLLAAEHRNPFDAVVFHDSDDLLEGGVLGNRHYALGHHLRYFASMRTHIFLGERADIGHIFDSPPSIVLDAELGAPEEVALSYNPH